MMSPQDLKTEILANVKTDFGEGTSLYQAIMHSEFDFDDTNIFSRKIWDSYSRYLKIFCISENKRTLEQEYDYLLKLADGIHGAQNDNDIVYFITKINIFVKNNVNSDVYSTEKIIICGSVTIETDRNYINQGGFGRIYKFYDNYLQMSFAYKIFDPSPFQQEDTANLLKRFVREGKKLLKYRHKNIVAAYDLGEISGSNVHYIKMEYVDGKNIIDFILQNDLDMSSKIKIADQFISAMAYIHSCGDLHRDISYQNILVTPDQQVKVIDFGFSKGREDTSFETTQYPLASKFSAPESTGQIKDSFVAEVYSIGAILYSIFTQKRFHNQNIYDIELTETPLRYKSVILKCLNADPSKRIKKAYHINWHLRNEGSITLETFESLNLVESYSLDWLSDFIEANIVNIIFKENCLPSFSNTQDWVENGFKESIHEHAFVSNILFHEVLFKFKDIKRIEFKRNAIKNILKLNIYNAYKYYESIDASKKILFCKTINTIIKRRAIPEVSEYEVPF